MDEKAAADLFVAILLQARADLAVPRYAAEARLTLEFVGVKPQPFTNGQEKGAAIVRLLSGAPAAAPAPTRRAHRRARATSAATANAAP